MVLFEDELADNGTASLTLKIVSEVGRCYSLRGGGGGKGELTNLLYTPYQQRMMASGFLILMRFFLRVDGVLVRINDTRLYLQVREGLAGQAGGG